MVELMWMQSGSVHRIALGCGLDADIRLIGTPPHPAKTPKSLPAQRGGMAELADAADLKSVSPYCTTAKHLAALRLDRD